MPNIKYRAAVIGCGLIGTATGGQSKAALRYSHAYAYNADKRVVLAAVVDRDLSKAKQAGAFWKVPSYGDVAALFKHQAIDIVSICVPDEAHEALLKEVLPFKPKLVFCEKPLTVSLPQARAIANQYAKAKIPLAVNFSRRYNPAIRRLQEAITKGQYGSLINGCGVYTKGILHNGSHLIDLIRFLLGEIKDVCALGQCVDWKKTDPSLDAYLQLQSGAKMHIVAVDERVYSVFKLEMFFSKAHITIDHFGEHIVIEPVVADPVFKGYSQLGQSQRQLTKMSGNITSAINHLIDTLDTKGPLVCSANEAIKTQAVCTAILANQRT